MMIRRWIFCASLCLASVTGVVASAETLSVNFNNGGATLLDPADEVGFVPSVNWNNFRNNGGLGLFNPEATILVDSSGEESDATISWEVGASFFNSNNGIGNQRMMEGWFGLNEGDAGYIRFDDIPATFTTASYDAYVYFDSDRIAPNERTMTFMANGVTLVGTEMPTNFAGTFFESTAESAGNYVVFRDLTDPSFVLTADSTEGRAAITGIQLTTLPEPEPNLPPDPDAPIHLYNASNADNTDSTLFDEAGSANWSLVGVERVAVDSANTSITDAYQMTEVGVIGLGGDNGPYPGGNTTFELWVRPGESADDAEHQVVFETGGGQNGTSVLYRNDAIRILNSQGNEQGFDIEVPLADVDTSDFLQIVTTLSAEEGEIEVTVNGSAGGSATASAEGAVGRGGNRASLFTWGSGHNNSGNPADEPGGTFNLGGRTELDDMTPELLTQFAGQVAVMNVYSRVISDADIQESFDFWTAGAGVPGDYNGDGQLDVDDLNQLTAAVRNGDMDSQFDLDGNGSVDNADREFWVVDLKNTWFGDSNLDGKFDSTDFVTVFSAGEFEDDTPLNSNWEEGDWNGDGDFTTNDFVTAFQGGGYEQGERAATAAVPEPSGLTSSLLALIVMTLTRVRRWLKR